METFSQSLNKWRVNVICSDREGPPGPIASLKSRLVPYLAISLSSQDEGQMGQRARRVPAGPESPSCGPWLADTLPVCRRVLNCGKLPITLPVVIFSLTHDDVTFP